MLSVIYDYLSKLYFKKAEVNFIFNEINSICLTDSVQFVRYLIKCQA